MSDKLEAAEKASLYIKPISVRPRTAAQILGVSPPKVYELAARDDFHGAFKFGGCTLFQWRPWRNGSENSVRREVQMVSKNEKTPASAATLTGAVESGNICEMGHTSIKNNTISAPKRQIGLISDLLLCGAENAISRRDLMALTGYKDREVRRLIEQERRAGALILSDNQHGYYLAADESEVQQFVKSMRRRAAEIRLTAAYVAKAVMNHER